jgi:hypothetical protein
MLLCVTCLGLTSGLFAQRASDEAVLTYDIIRSERKSLVMESLDITVSQLDALSPIYDSYLAEHQMLEEHRLKVVQNFVKKYKALSDADAVTLLEEMQRNIRTRLALHDKYTVEFGKVLPPRTVLRLWQVEAKLDAIVNLQFAKEVPLAR